IDTLGGSKATTAERWRTVSSVGPSVTGGTAQRNAADSSTPRAAATHHRAIRTVVAVITGPLVTPGPLADSPTSQRCRRARKYASAAPGESTRISGGEGRHLSHHGPGGHTPHPSAGTGREPLDAATRRQPSNRQPAASVSTSEPKT